MDDLDPDADTPLRGWFLPLFRRGGIRLRVTIWATLIVAVTLVAASLALLFFVRETLLDSIDSDLEARARVVVEDPALSAIRGTIHANAQQTSLVQILDADGTVIAATANMRDGREYEPPVRRQPPVQRKTTISTVPASELAGESAARVLAEPVALANGPGWVYVADSLAGVETTTRSILLYTAIGVPLILLAFAFTVWRAVTAALRPVAQIRRRAAAITGADLSQRVPVPPTRDEIARLAVSMNAMLERLDVAATRQRQFIEDASHELRSPLAAVSAHIDVALADPDPADSRRVLQVVRDQVTRMTALTADLLFLARSGDAATSVGIEIVDLDEIVLAEAKRLSDDGRHGVTTVEIDAARTVGSRGDLARALRKLTDNAQDHARSEVRLALAVRNGMAEITVSDDGGGIPEADRQRVFERFSRLDDARARSVAGGGFGLGLAIARQIALDHGGTLTAHARSDGRPGAEFLLRIPAAADADESPESAVVP